MDISSERPVSVRELADHFGVGQRTVRRWMAAGLESMRLGRTIFSTWEAVDRFASRSETPNCPPPTSHSSDHAELMKKHGRSR